MVLLLSLFLLVESSGYWSSCRVDVHLQPCPARLLVPPSLHLLSISCPPKEMTLNHNHLSFLNGLIDSSRFSLPLVF